MTPDRTCRVLHVEDNPADARLIQLHLRGMEVRSVARLRDVEQALHDQRADVVLLDLSLPDSEGLATVDQALALAGQIPVVVLTGAADEELGLGAVRRGAHDYVVKTPDAYATIPRILRYAIERSALRQRIAHLDRLAMMGSITAAVAHELANPAAFLKINTGLLDQHLARLAAVSGDHAELVAQCREIVADNLEGLDQMRRLLRDMTSFSRPDHVVDRETVSVTRIAETAARLMRTPIDGRARLELALEDVPPVRGDARRLQQVLVNLLANACDATRAESGASPVIRLSSRVDGDTAVIEVSDEGAGMDEATRGRVFEPFFTTKGERGTGLGLSLAAEIVRQHGGRIAVRSAPGEGTTFTISLPLREAATRTSPGLRPRILVVDDEPRLLSAMERRLEATFRIVTAEGVGPALEILRGGERFDLVLSDLAMPDGGGPALYHAMVEERPDLLEALVFCTGGQMSTDLREFTRDVPNRVLRKPVDAELLRQLASSPSAGHDAPAAAALWREG